MACRSCERKALAPVSNYYVAPSGYQRAEGLAEMGAVAGMAAPAVGAGIGYWYASKHGHSKLLFTLGGWVAGNLTYAMVVAGRM